MIRRYLLPRPLHPFAWWGWAIALAVVASMTTNPLLLASLMVVATLVTVSRRGDNPWAKGFRYYLVLAGFIVVVRIAFRVLFGGGDGPTVLFRLPEIPLPAWVGGIRLLGPVSLESLLHGAYDGMRLATVIVCVGAANSLVNPKRLLAALPSALYELGTILIVAFSALPQLGDSIRRVLKVRRLRRARAATTRRQRLGVVETIVVPVLSDALERSVALAASMEARGYGRAGDARPAERARATALGLAGVALLSVWSYELLAQPRPGRLRIAGVDVVELALLVLGLALVVLAMRVTGRHVRRTRYRPDRFGVAETLTVLCGAAGVGAVQWLRRHGDPSALAPEVAPFTWPQLTPTLLALLVVAAVPAFATPPPALTATPAPKEGLP